MRLPRLTALQPRERALAILGAAAVLVVLLDRVVLSPWMRHVRHIQEETRTLERVLQAHQRLLARKAQVFAERSRYQPYFKPAVADDLQMAALLKEMEDLAGQSRVAVSEIKPLNVETQELAKQYALEVRFTCGFEEWVRFVYQIETSPAVYQITRAGLSVQDGAPDRLEGFLRLVSASMRGDTIASAEDITAHETAP